MNNGGEAADQMVREALQVTEVAIKLSALGIKNALAFGQIGNVGLHGNHLDSQCAAFPRCGVRGGLIAGVVEHQINPFAGELQTNCPANTATTSGYNSDARSGCIR